MPAYTTKLKYFTVAGWFPARKMDVHQRVAFSRRFKIKQSPNHELQQQQSSLVPTRRGTSDELDVEKMEEQP